MPLTALRTPLVLAAFLFPIAVVFDKNFISVYLVGLIGGAVIFGRPFALRLWTPLVGAVGTILLLCLLSALWSIDAGHSVTRFLRLALAAGGGTLLCALAAARDFDTRRAAATALAAGLLTASLIALFARYGPAFLPTGSVATYLSWMPVLSYGAVAALLVFVLAATLAEGPVPVVVPVAIAAAALAVLLSGNGASAIALGAGIAAAMVVFWLGRRAVVVLSVLLPLIFLAMPVVLQKADAPAFIKGQGWTLDHSAAHRLIIWRYVFGKIEERPVLGWGLHASRILPDRNARVFGDPRYADVLDLTDFTADAKIELMPMHPHNATLQIWLELGAFGLILYGILYGLVLFAMSRVVRSRIARAAGAGAIVAVFVIGQLSFNVWQSWWLIAQFLAAAFFLFAIPKLSITTPRDQAAQPG